MAAATPISPHHDRSKGGERSEGEDLTTPPGARRRKRPTAAGLWQAPAQAGRWPAPRPEHGRFPGQAALRKPPGTHRRMRPAPKMPPEHHPRAPFGKGRQKSRQKENIDIVGKDKKDAPGFIQSHARMPETISSVNPGSAYPSQDYGNVSCAPHTPVWR